MYEQYDGTMRYDEQSGYGVLPNGTGVKFSDGTTGTVAQGFTNGTSLVSFPSGKGTANRDVYANSSLKIRQ